MPWNEYGLVRGLNAPARISRTPRAMRYSAVRRIIASFSTEHGPAMIVNVPGPMTVPLTGIYVSASCISRLASLYGLVTRISSATPGSTSSVRGSMAPTLPVMPMAVRIAPGIGCGVRFMARMRAPPHRPVAALRACP